MLWEFRTHTNQLESQFSKPEYALHFPHILKYFVVSDFHVNPNH